MKFSRKVGNGSINKWLNFLAIRIKDTDMDPDPYLNTGKTCLGGGMHCSSASSLFICLLIYLLLGRIAVLHRYDLFLQTE